MPSTSIPAECSRNSARPNGLPIRSLPSSQGIRKRVGSQRWTCESTIGPGGMAAPPSTSKTSATMGPPSWRWLDACDVHRGAGLEVRGQLRSLALAEGQVDPQPLQVLIERLLALLDTRHGEELLDLGGQLRRRERGDPAQHPDVRVVGEP